MSTSQNSDPLEFLGASQLGEINPHLDPDIVKLDSRTTPELLDFTAKISDQFWYYNIKNEKEGDWSDFFKTDLSAILATISQKDEIEAYQKVLDFLNGINFTYQTENKAFFLREVFFRVFNTALEINRWYMTMTQYFVKEPYQVYLDRIIWQKLSFQLKDIYAYYYGALKTDVINDKEKVDNMFKELQKLQPIWNFNPFPYLDENTALQLKFSTDQDAYINGLQAPVKEFFNLYSSLVKKADDEFHKSLSTGNVEPHISLLLSFFKIYKHQQKAINRMVPRHMNFYYKRVLDFHKNGASPDSAFVLLTLNKSATSPYGLLATTQMSAGADSAGNQLIFATDKDMMVLPSIIGSYLTMYSDSVWTGENDKARDFVTAAVKSFSSPVIDKVTNTYESFFMFGQPADDSSIVPPAATLGFAITSPELWLEGGDRQLKITFTLQEVLTPTDSESSNKENETSNSGDSSTTADSSSPELSQLLEFSITGAKGWLSPTCSDVTLTDKALTITLGFDNSVKSVTDYNLKIHGPGYNTSWPVLKATLTQGAAITSCQESKSNGDKQSVNTSNAYEVFAAVNFTEFSVESTVNNLSVQTLRTSSGPAQPTATVAPFGNIPALGAKFLIGTYEPFIKRTSAMCVYLNWVNLLSEDEFSTYYTAYNNFITEYETGDALFARTNYDCTLTWLDQGEWSPVGDKAVSVSLFEANTNDCDDLVIIPPTDTSTPTEGSGDSSEKAGDSDEQSNSSSGAKTEKVDDSDQQSDSDSTKTDKTVLTPRCYEVDIKDNDPQYITPDYSLVNPVKYSDQSKSGFIALTLTASPSLTSPLPNEPFGNDLYSKVVSDVALKNTMKAAKEFMLLEVMAKNLKPIIEFLKKNIKAILTLIFVKIIGTILKKIRQLIMGIVHLLIGIVKYAVQFVLSAVINLVLLIFKLLPFKKLYNWLKNWVDKHLPKLAKFPPKLPSLHTPGSGDGGDQKGKDAKTNTFSPIPNKPYLPKAKEFSISYKACLTITPGADSNHQYYKIHPFGTEEVASGNTSLIAQYPEWGYVFLSFDALPANSTMNLFLGIKDQQDTIISEDFKSVGVEYLTSSGWQSINVQSDSTYGLNKDGIITFQIGDDPSNSNPIMPVKSFWIRLSGDHAQVIDPSLTMMSTNAVQVTRVITSTNEWDSLDDLEAGTIKSFIQPTQEVSKITQPFPSFGGEEPETKRTFRQRVAKRINHKERGQSVNNIQSIILDKFKEIYRVNVVPGKFLTGVGNEEIHIAVVPKIASTSNLDIYKPVAKASVLTEVLLELTGKINDFLVPSVYHAGFEELLVSVDVVFTKPDQYFELIDQLNADLADFLSPWIEGNILANIKEVLYVNDIIKFISNRDYVASFDNLSLYLDDKIIYDPANDQASGNDDQQAIYPEHPMNILVTASAHNINSTVALPVQNQNEEPPVQSNEAVEA